MSLLSHLPAIKIKASRRLGRGYGSKKGGHTSSRGQKGQLSRSGGKPPIWFEGGQLPFVRRFPWQRGKDRLKSLQNRQEVQLRDIVKHGLTQVNPNSLFESGLVSNTKDLIRIIGQVEVDQAIELSDVQTSAPVAQAIEKAGGSIK